MKKKSFLLFSIACFALTFSVSARIPASDYIIFDVRIDGVNSSDTAELYLWDHIITDEKRFQTPHEKLSIPSKAGHFVFQAKCPAAIRYISLAFGERDNTFGTRLDVFSLYLSEPGDSISAIVLKDSISFEGKGAEKYRCRYQIERRAREFATFFHGRVLTEAETRDSMYFFRASCEYYGREAFLLTTQLQILEGFRASLSPSVYGVMKADLIGKHAAEYYDEFFLNSQRFLTDGFFYMPGVYSVSASKKALLEMSKVAGCFDSIFFSYKPARVALGISKDWVLAIADRIRCRHALALDKRSPYRVIKEDYEGVLRDRLMANYFVQKMHSLAGKDSLMADALKITTLGYCRNAIENVFDNQRTGAIAYDFSLPDSSGKIVHLSDFRGKVVFIDFWFVGCYGCTLYFKNDVSAAEEHFKDNKDVVFVAISIDKDQHRWLQGVNSMMYTSPSAVNLYTGGAGVHSPLIERYQVTAYPCPMLIDKEGRIISTSESDLGEKKDLIKKIVGALAK